MVLVGLEELSRVNERLKSLRSGGGVFRIILQLTRAGLDVHVITRVSSVLGDHYPQNSKLTRTALRGICAFF